MSEGIQNKMYNYEVTPPPGVWDHIATALDESELDCAFPSALYKIEVTPPPASWEKINAALDDDQGIVRPFQRRISPLLKYAAAAAVVGLIAFGSLRLFKKNNARKDLAKEKVIAPVNNPAGLGANADASEEAINDSTLKANEQIIAKLDIPSRIQKKNMAGAYMSNRDYFTSEDSREDEYDNSPGMHEDQLAVATAVEHTDLKNDNNSRYVLLMTPDGNIVRMSKKLCDLVCCVSGQEQDPDCKSQLKIWQDKMASSTVAPSPGNFMDILNLVSTLQENNN